MTSRYLPTWKKIDSSFLTMYALTLIKGITYSLDQQNWQHLTIAFILGPLMSTNKTQDHELEFQQEKHPVRRNTDKVRHDIHIHTPWQSSSGLPCVPCPRTSQWGSQPFWGHFCTAWKSDCSCPAPRLNATPVHDWCMGLGDPPWTVWPLLQWCLSGQLRGIEIDTNICTLALLIEDILGRSNGKITSKLSDKAYIKPERARYQSIYWLANLPQGKFIS